MNFRNNYLFRAMLLLSAMLFNAACEDDYSAIGVDLVESGAVKSTKAIAEVEVKNIKFSAVGTNRLEGYQLGEYNDPVFGLTKASVATQVELSSGTIFGDLSQETENASEGDEDPGTLPENERVTKVYLYLPFYSTELVDTTDAPDTDPRPFRVDSIFGNRNTTFKLKVAEFTKFLRDTDPNSGFTETQEYFSNEDASPFIGAVLLDSVISINEEEILLFENEDDPDTPDTDESTLNPVRIPPGIRVELDPEFFQTKILDMEGSEQLSNATFFKDYFRGIHLSVEVVNDDLNLLLPFEGDNVSISANIEVRYEYDDFNNNGTAEDSTDDFVDVAEGKLTLNLRGNRVNYLESEAYPAGVASAFNTLNPERLYLQGGAGSMAEIDLSAIAGPDGFVALARENKWLINDASIIVYVDEQELLNQGVSDLASRLYLYDLDNERGLVDYFRDLAESGAASGGSLATFGGILDKNRKEGPGYRFRITEHLKNIIDKDSTNYRLGLTMASNVLNSTVVKAFDANGNKVNVPRTSVSNTKGIILFGKPSGAGEEARRVRLEIYYTEPNQ